MAGKTKHITPAYIIVRLQQQRLPYTNEKFLQDKVQQILAPHMPLHREWILDENNRIDFFTDGIGIECKIKGSPSEIYRQCERYCQFDQINHLILVTNKPMGFPPMLNGKNCYVVNLAKAWL